MLVIFAPLIELRGYIHTKGNAVNHKLITQEPILFIGKMSFVNGMRRGITRNHVCVAQKVTCLEVGSHFSNRLACSRCSDSWERRIGGTRRKNIARADGALTAVKQ